MTRRSQRQQKKAEVASSSAKTADGDGGSTAGGDEAENVFEMESVTGGGEGSEGKTRL